MKREKSRPLWSRDPTWVHNLRVNPDVEIRDETVVRPMRLREVGDEAERSRL